ncbi:unnamed protein product [Arabis nemorensis]|uniref:Polygalacturonase At3g15720 n=1 Tax=Arabis nemorensis TaxID=586526 RepID=A0A565CE39_9BRAS|nr:unnamed protein product [Arabis nemorensis]
MGFEILVSVLLIASYHLQCGDSRMTLSIKDFLPDSNDTNVDHTRALQDAWRALCRSKISKSLVIRANEIYTTRPQLFQGPCASRRPHIQIDGTIEAPKTVAGWGKVESWLHFDSITGLVLDGSGVLNAHGENWWPSVELHSRPHSVMFNGCKFLTYKGITQRNSPSNHISITSSTAVTLSNIHLIAPANSPNTDGIDISSSNHIHILGSSIETGDDCIALNSGSHDINITSVTCGPGHGISIGSLGKGGAIDTVQNVNVRHCTFKGTQNGARIKTWGGGRGFARNILFEDITLINAQLPINIDQQYTGRCCGMFNAVKVSDVTFRQFRGTVADGVAIHIDCDRVGCDNILLEHINIASSSPRIPLTAFCRFARVISRFVSIPVKCSSRNDLECPSPCPQAHAPYAKPPAPLAQPPSFFPFPYIF